MAGESELSIEETNKLRISLGLKPLKVDSDPAKTEPDGSKTYDNTTEGRERQAVDNWKKHQERADKEESRKRVAEDIRRAKEQAQRFRLLEGKGLADDDEGKGGGAEEEEDTTTWLKKMKKRQKKLAEKMAREKEEELERMAKEQREYTSADLKGVRVAHDLAELGEAGGAILTLKDTTVDENEEEGDELVSTDLIERERLQERLELKKKKPAYNPNEELDSATGEKRLLAQYDDEDEKKAKKRFVLDGTGTLATNETYRQEVAEKLRQKVVSLDIPKPEVASDYIDPSTMKIKKPKKKKKRSTRKRSDDDDVLNPAVAEPSPSDEGADVMQVDNAPAPKKPRISEDTSLIDDDDLQSALALQRRTALKKRRILKPSELAEQLRAESATPSMDLDDAEEPGLVIDETSEFVTTLQAPVIERKPRPRSDSATPPSVSPEPDEDGSGDIDMVRDEHSPSTPSPPEMSSTGLEEETTISRGVGTTLAMLNQRGLLKRNPEAEKKLQLSREREAFRRQKRLREVEAEERAKAQRARDRQSGKFDRMSAREREEHARWENKQRDLQEARDLADRFQNYKPDIELHYKDEFGREMNQKEAFKYLSHQFHGKGSGKAKTEKRLKKIDDEKKREAASNLSSGGQENAVQSAAKRTKQAGVRIM